MKNITLSLLLTVSALMAQEAKQRLTPELLWKMARVSSPVVSPDEKTIVYGVSKYELAKNKGDRNLFIMSADGGQAQQLTSLKGSEFNVRWKPDGSKVGFYPLILVLFKFRKLTLMDLI